MADLIDRAVLKAAFETYKEHDLIMAKQVLRLVDILPTAERKGRWVNNIHDIPICNKCGYMTPYDRAIDDYEYGNYCPNCGARMGEIDDDND